ncbi:MAG: hypothetical protein M1819_005057 [Sarea resinae]|nr:MAG: hypothetical protein M1819_005057 [Sarea resinae]
MKRFKSSSLPLCLVALLVSNSRADLPYNPARVLMSAKDNGLAYIFLPANESSSDFQYLRLNITSNLDASSLSYDTLSPSLPFLSSDNSTAFTPIIDGDGDVSVYAGSCDPLSGGSSIWRFMPEEAAGKGRTGAWSQQSVDLGQLNTLNVLSGANFLSAGISFSSAADGDAANSTFYIFGGMCPSNHSSSASWQSSADYSNYMLTLTPAASHDAGPSNTSYSLGLSSSRGPPVAEAGFSITSLQPTYSNQTGNYQSQQEDFVLIGGHTQSAFINMSQIALFSLPQQGWTFISVDADSSEAKTDLAARSSSTDVDPRSGHTAVLTPDGKKIVVFGGWVGDVTNPAEPQLVVLNVGEGYGGESDWSWSVPSPTGGGPDISSGIYGHAALMLPGGVMMIIGGYSIPASKTKAKRANPDMNSDVYFFNVSSSAWMTTYVHPSIASSSVSHVSQSGPLSSISQKAGFGTGIALGLSAVGGAIAVFVLYSRRLKRRREIREKELHDLALTAHRFGGLDLADEYCSGQIGGRNDMEWIGDRQRAAREAAYPYGARVHDGASGEGPGWKAHSGTDAERTGLLVEIPSPTRGLRRSLHSRATYAPSPRYEDLRRSGGSGAIHVINESEEYDEPEMQPSYTDLEMSERGDSGLIPKPLNLDPFRDPDPSTSNAGADAPWAHHSPARERERELQAWVQDWAAADVLLHSPGRNSPDKTDRTSSTLSDRSMHSLTSARSAPHTTVQGRSSSQTPQSFNRKSPSPTSDHQGRGSPSSYGRSQSLTLQPRPNTANTGDSFATAATSFAQLQAEGETLLGGRASGVSSSGPSSPNRSRAKAFGWIGSVRRALPFSGERGTSSSPSPTGDRSSSSSPIKHFHHSDGLPRRAASASAAVWRQRKGAADWDVARPADGGSHEGNLLAEDNDEWDVEAAIENRVVQVMFTVPREKLRVVNQDVERASLSDVGDVEEYGKREQGDEDVAARGTSEAKGKEPATE